MSVWEQIGRFDDSARPEKPEGFGQQRPGVDVLPEGKYVLQVSDAECRETQKQKLPILAVGLQVLTPAVHAGQVVEHTWFLDGQDKVNRCWADLVTLGMPATGTFSQQLQAFLARLPGRQFQGTRKDNGTYHNLHIDYALGGAPTPQPAAPAFNEFPEPAAPAAPTDGEIPW